MAATSTDQLAEALDATGGLVAGIRDDQWTDATPCDEWNVRQLLNHLVAGNRLFARSVRGEAAPPDLASWATSDMLGDDAADAYRKAATELVEAFARPGALEQTVAVPIGEIPGMVALNLRIVEALVHGWDLATATGQAAPHHDEALAEQALAFTEAALSDIPPDRRPFGPPQPVEDGAPALDRLAARLGREVPARGNGG